MRTIKEGPQTLLLSYPCPFLSGIRVGHQNCTFTPNTPPMPQSR